MKASLVLLLTAVLFVSGIVPTVQADPVTVTLTAVKDCEVRAPFPNTAFSNGSSLQSLKTATLANNSAMFWQFQLPTDCDASTITSVTWKNVLNQAAPSGTNAAYFCIIRESAENTISDLNTLTWNTAPGISRTAEPVSGTIQYDYGTSIYCGYQGYPAVAGTEWAYNVNAVTGGPYWNNLKSILDTDHNGKLTFFLHERYIREIPGQFASIENGTYHGPQIEITYEPNPGPVAACDSLSFTHRYEGDCPVDSYYGPYTNDTVIRYQNATESWVQNGVAHFVISGCDSAINLYSTLPAETLFDRQTGYTLEFRAARDPNQSCVEGTSYAIGLGTNQGGKEFLFRLYSDHFLIYNDGGSYSIYELDGVPIDPYDFYTVRAALQSGAELFDVWINDLYQGQYGYTTNRDICRMGDLGSNYSGTFVLDYFRFDNTGAYAPFVAARLEETDDDTTVIEGGVGDSYQLHFYNDPYDDVGVTISPSSPDIALNGQAPGVPLEISVQPTGNPEVPPSPITITVTANDDEESEGPETIMLLHDFQSYDLRFDGLELELPVDVTDNEPWCGMEGTEFNVADINQDCYIDMADLASLCSKWLACTDPTNDYCGELFKPLSLTNNKSTISLNDGSLLRIIQNKVDFSEDLGKTWSPQTIIYDGPAPGRLGGGKVVQTSAGTIVHVYVDPDSYHWYWDSATGQADPNSELNVWAIRSTDGGQTWTDRQMIFDGYCGALIDVIATSSGHVVAPVQRLLHDPSRHSTRVYVSADEGQTWSVSNLLDIGGWGHHDGAFEGTLAELDDGRLWLLLRTNMDYFYESFSDDHGYTWSEPTPTAIDASSSPGYLLRLKSGRLALIWNRLYPSWLQSGQESTYPRRGFPYSLRPASWQREELSIALSDDDGLTWTAPMIIDTDVAYSSYPYAVEPEPGRIWIFASGTPMWVYESRLWQESR